VDSKTNLPEVPLSLHDGQLSQGVFIHDTTHVDKLAEAVFIINEVLVDHHLTETFIFWKGLDVFEGVNFEAWDLKTVDGEHSEV